MGRILIKGGVWRNTEDEILKAAVMKYGKNQWSRIASLLHRKSAKQCKARWYEWLDPSIKKTEWSREEEEKLLHLAKLMPTQWRTISSIVGRTAAQCLEHYEELLDQAQKKDESKEGEDVKKLKPGEIDPNPETKPARPDPKDMDEDELEMLSEARARLANTQGKKAKRKAREKQLEEARRLASLQKRRELRMAGINIGIGNRKKRKGLDYNAEIPFNKPVPAGFHDVSEEVWEKPEQDFRKLRQQQLDGELRTEKEEKERKKDKKKMEKKKENGMPVVVDTEASISKRSKLVLPQPRISETELEQVVKLGHASESAKASVIEESDKGTDGLLADYSVTSASSIATMRTPKTAALSRDSILMEAQNLIALQNVETPLKGGENTPLVEATGFGSSFKTPGTSAIVSATPNALISMPFRTPGGQKNNAPGGPNDVTATPGTGQSDSFNSATPCTPSVRDKYTINPESSLAFDSERVAKEFQKEVKAQIREAFTNLPEPKNEYEIVIDDKSMKDDESVVSSSLIEDQADLDAKREREEEEKIEAEFRRQSKAVQRDLPRPSVVNNNILKSSDVVLSELQQAEEMIKKEMLTIIHHDVLRNPSANQMVKSSSSESSTYLANNPYREANEEEIEQANELIRDEMDFVREKMNHGDLSEETLNTVWQECLAEVIFVAGQPSRVARRRDVSTKEKIDTLQWRLQKNREHMLKEAKKAGKIEKKLKILLGGYQARAASLLKQINDTASQIESLKLEKVTFQQLQVHEDLAVSKRISALKDDVSRQIAREKDCQEKYDTLKRRKEQLQVLLRITANGDVPSNV